MNVFVRQFAIRGVKVQCKFDHSISKKKLHQNDLIRMTILNRCENNTRKNKNDANKCVHKMHDLRTLKHWSVRTLHIVVKIQHRNWCVNSKKWLVITEKKKREKNISSKQWMKKIRLSRDASRNAIVLLYFFWMHCISHIEHQNKFSIQRFFLQIFNLYWRNDSTTRHSSRESNFIGLVFIVVIISVASSPVFGGTIISIKCELLLLLNGRNW